MRSALAAIGLVAFLILLTFAGIVPWYLWLIPIIGMGTVIFFGVISQGYWTAPSLPVYRNDVEIVDVEVIDE